MGGKGSRVLFAWLLLHLLEHCTEPGSQVQQEAGGEDGKGSLGPLCVGEESKRALSQAGMDLSLGWSLSRELYAFRQS